MFKWVNVIFLLLLAVLSEPLVASQCKRLFNDGELKKAKEVCLQSSQSADKTSEEYLWSQLVLFDIAHYLGDQKQAYESLLSISGQPLTEDISYELLRRQGDYFRIQKRYRYAQSYYFEALAIAEKQKNPTKLAKSYNDVGLLFLKDKDYQQSIKYFKKSLSIKKQLNNPVLLRSTLTNLGLLSHKTADYEGALNYYTQVQNILNDLKKDNNDSQVIESQNIHLYTYFAAVYDKLTDYTKRDEYLSLFNDGMDSLHIDASVLDRYMNFIEVLIEAKSFYVAKQFAEKVNVELKHLEDNNVQLFYQLAFLEYQFENHEVAKVYANKALKDMQTHQSFGYEQKVFQVLALIEKSLNQPVAALAWYEKYQAALIKDMEQATSHDFRLLRYEQNLENSRSLLTQQQLKASLLEKQKTTYYLGLLATLALFFLVLVFFYYQRKIMLKDKHLLQKDIDKHKAICQNLQKPPVNFKYLLRNKSFPCLVMDDVNRIIYANFLDDPKAYRALEKALLSSSMHTLIETGMPVNYTEPVPARVEKLLGLSDVSHFTAQKVISGQYCLIFFCQQNECLNVDAELNALEQFEFYLEHQHIKDASYKRKLVVDCMTFCLETWKKRTASNKIEFADQSKVWKINIDDGRLRTRSLDKYFSLDSIPKNPRVTQVIKSCHFMLTLTELKVHERNKFKYYLNKLENA